MAVLYGGANHVNLFNFFYDMPGQPTGMWTQAATEQVLRAMASVKSLDSLIFHNVLGLAVSLFGVAGIFIYLNSPFLAMMEILIYVGAICIAICFAIMLSEPLYLPKPPRKPIKLVGAGLGAGLVFFMLAILVKKTAWVPASGPGHRLVGDHHRSLSADQICPHL